MTSTLLQLNPGIITDAATKVQPGDYSGYTFAIIVLALILVGSIYSIKTLYDKNTELQTAAVKRAEDTTKELTKALNEVEKQYNEFTRGINLMNDTLKDIKAKI